MGHDDLTGSTLRETVRKRADVLESLSDEAAGKPALVERLGVSRSTVDRAVDDLVDIGLVRRVDSEYRMTPQGRMALDIHEEYVDLTDALGGAAPVLDALPTGAPFPRSMVETGTVRLAQPHAPESAITEALDALASAERLRVFSPVVKSSYVRPVAEEVVGRGLDVDLVLGAEASESLVALAEVTDAVEDLVDAPSFTLHRTDRDLPFLLYLLLGGESDATGVTVHEGGGIVGSVTTRDEAAVSWARGLYEEVAADAEAVPPSSLEF
jgi:predicted transcriptional regulator